MGYPQTVVNMAREYIDVIDNMRSGRYSGDEMEDMEGDRRVLHSQLEQFLSQVWKNATQVTISDMYSYAHRIIMGNNLGGR